MNETWLRHSFQSSSFSNFPSTFKNCFSDIVCFIYCYFLTFVQCQYCNMVGMPENYCVHEYIPQ